MNLCKRCLVAGDEVRATHLVPGAPPRYLSLFACALHAAPYKTARKLPLDTSN